MGASGQPTMLILGSLERLPRVRLIELLSLGVTAEALRAKIGDFDPTRSLEPKISGRRGRSPPTIFAWIVRPMNALQLCR